MEARMQIKKATVWWLVNGAGGLAHPAVTSYDKTIKELMPLVSQLFPGINYYSVTGFSQAMKDCVMPALKKLYPELEGVPSDSIADDDLIEIKEFLPSNGYEWQDSDQWKTQFATLLAA
jgi:hypothetical protein